MAITKLTQDVDLPPPDNSAGIQFICPVCKTNKSLQFPKSIVNQAKGLTTMSIAKGLVCNHQFQAFVDKNFMVRGYQRVDFEFEKITNEDEKSLFSKKDRSDDELFKNLILEGNYLEYTPKQKKEDKNVEKKKAHNDSMDKIKPLQEVYNEFWEFIDEDNTIFQRFIKNDVRRKNLYP